MKAEQHHQKAVMKFSGWRPWCKLIENKRSREKAASDFYTKGILRYVVYFNVKVKLPISAVIFNWFASAARNYAAATSVVHVDVCHGLPADIRNCVFLHCLKREVFEFRFCFLFFCDASLAVELCLSLFPKNVDHNLADSVTEFTGIFLVCHSVWRSIHAY